MKELSIDQIEQVSGGIATDVWYVTDITFIDPVPASPYPVWG